MPARPSTARAFLPQTRPVPWGAGLMVTSVEAHLPEILNGTEVGVAPLPDCQEPEPRCTSMRLILARSMARLMVGPTSLPPGHAGGGEEGARVAHRAAGVQRS